LQDLKQFDLDQRFCKYGSLSEGVSITNDIAALPEVEHHNNQIQAAIDFHCNNRPSFAIIDKGRNNEERSCIWVENGHFMVWVILILK
jgi:DNA polymerase-3 subunit epsilon